MDAETKFMSENIPFKAFYANQVMFETQDINVHGKNFFANQKKKREYVIWKEILFIRLPVNRITRKCSVIDTNSILMKCNLQYLNLTFNIHLNERLRWKILTIISTIKSLLNHAQNCHVIETNVSSDTFYASQEVWKLAFIEHRKVWE